MGKFKYPRELIEKAQSGDREAVWQILLKMKGFITTHANRVCLGNSALDMDDLIQAGNLATMRAINRFDLDLGQAQFQTYAGWAVLNALHSMAREQTKRDDNEFGRDHSDLDEIPRLVSSGFDLATLVAAINCLDGLERKVLLARLGTAIEGLAATPWSVVEKSVGLTSADCQRLYAIAIEKIRNKLFDD